MHSEEEGHKMKGDTSTIHLVWKVPAGEEEKAVDAYWKKHEEWMRKSHSVGVDGAEPRLLSFNISKGEELTDPLNPESEKTGSILYIMSEIYAAPAGIKKHMDLADAEGKAETDLLPQLMTYNAKYGQFMEAGTGTVFTSFADDAKPFETPKGNPGIHLIWKVDAADEATADAYWTKHEAWMRKSHTMGAAGDDKTGPRLSSFTISKGKELKDPLNPESEKTGKIIYIMDETYVAPEGIKKHMELAAAEGEAETDLLPQLKAYQAKYGHFIEVGSTTVFTNIKD
jgi:hypothetical protein